MRRKLLLFSMFFLLLLTSVFAQTLQDYVKETRGDTLVVKDDFDYGAPDALSLLMNADTNPPAGRVYMLHNNGYYSIVNNPTSSATQKTIIMGESNQSVKTRKDAGAPPILAGAVYEGGTTTGGINSGYDLLVKNANVAIGNSAGGIGWGFFGLAGPGLRIQVDNCIIEHNLWTVIGGPPAESRIFFTNNYFVNLVGHTCRRNGGVLDFFSDQDTILVENNTHVNVQGLLYKSRTGYRINRQIYNHNNFINCSATPNMNTGDHPNYSVTNNIFVNCQLQGYATILQSKDVGEVDPDDLPMGLVNVLVDSAFIANGASFYADKNLAYWDPSLSDIISTLNNNAVNGATDWESNMITMNSRTEALFADDAKYPLLTNGEWFLNKLPNFADTKDLFTTQLAVLKEFSISTVDTNFTGSLAAWRQPENPEAEYFTYADWPIPIDLSYTDSDLLTAGLNGFPIGDLNWFPTQYSAWLAQRDQELEQIHKVLTIGTDVKEVDGLPVTYKLDQNYPNPFNPSTVINFTIPKAGNVTLKVYNTLGQEVATLVNEYKNASNYQVTFNANNLSSGIYFYTINAGDFSLTKKMMLIK